ncbi:MAG: hypothetical protein HRU19_19375 [Pseudobacteriovorax sp.]|nr:hypothetical protein [Pseudobacteriovorax sp.]
MKRILLFSLLAGSFSSQAATLSLNTELMDCATETGISKRNCYLPLDEVAVNDSDHSIDVTVFYKWYCPVYLFRDWGIAKSSATTEFTVLKASSTPDISNKITISEVLPETSVKFTAFPEFPGAGGIGSGMNESFFTGEFSSSCSLKLESVKKTPSFAAIKLWEQEAAGLIQSLQDKYVIYKNSKAFDNLLNLNDRTLNTLRENIRLVVNQLVGLTRAEEGAPSEPSFDFDDIDGGIPGIGEDIGDEEDALFYKEKVVVTIDGSEKTIEEYRVKCERPSLECTQAWPVWFRNLESSTLKDTILQNLDIWTLASNILGRRDLGLDVDPLDPSADLEELRNVIRQAEKFLSDRQANRDSIKIIFDELLKNFCESGSTVNAGGELCQR